MRTPCSGTLPIGLRQAPREWHDTLRNTLAALGFAPSTADPSLFLRTDTSLPPFYVLVYVDDLVFAIADTEALTLGKSELQKRHTCTDLGLSTLRLQVLLATAHSSVYQPLALSSTFGRVLAELVDFAARCRLDYAASLVAESASVCPPSFGGECALGTDVLEDRQEEFQCFAAALPHLVSTLLAPEGDPDAPDIPTPRSYAEAIEEPYSSQWQAAMDAAMASWKSTCVIVTIGLNVPKTKDREHRRISVQRLKTLIAFWSQL
ncbi:unnamed protein product [Closterium sp. NIES-53]